MLYGLDAVNIHRESLGKLVAKIASIACHHYLRAMNVSQAQAERSQRTNVEGSLKELEKERNLAEKTATLARNQLNKLEKNLERTVEERDRYVLCSEQCNTCSVLYI